MERLALEKDGFKIPVTLSGEGERTLVCVNAAQMTMGAWRVLIKSFTSDTGHRLVLFDFPNQGKGATLDEYQDLAQQTDVVDTVVRHVSPNAPVDLLGVSWGSAVAAAYAARFPSAVRRLMLGSFHVVASAPLREFSPKCKALIERDAKREIADLFISTFGSGLTPAYGDAIRKQFEHLTIGELSQLRRQCEEVIKGSDLRDYIDFSHITARILILNGADDPLITATDNEVTRRVLPQAELRVVTSVGHFLHVEKANIVDEYISYLKRRSSTFMRIPDEVA